MDKPLPLIRIVTKQELSATSDNKQPSEPTCDLSTPSPSPTHLAPSEASVNDLHIDHTSNLEFEFSSSENEDEDEEDQVLSDDIKDSLDTRPSDSFKVGLSSSLPERIEFPKSLTESSENPKIEFPKPLPTETDDFPFIFPLPKEPEKTRQILFPVEQEKVTPTRQILFPVEPVVQEMLTRQILFPLAEMQEPTSQEFDPFPITQPAKIVPDKKLPKIDRVLGIEFESSPIFIPESHESITMHGLRKPTNLKIPILSSIDNDYAAAENIPMDYISEPSSSVLAMNGSDLSITPSPPLPCLPKPEADLPQKLPPIAITETISPETSYSTHQFISTWPLTKSGYILRKDYDPSSSQNLKSENTDNNTKSNLVRALSKILRRKNSGRGSRKKPLTSSPPPSPSSRKSTDSGKRLFSSSSSSSSTQNNGFQWNLYFVEVRGSYLFFYSLSQKPSAVRPVGNENEGIISSFLARNVRFPFYLSKFLPGFNRKPLPSSETKKNERRGSIASSIMTMESKPEPDATEASNEIYNFASEKEIQALDRTLVQYIDLEDIQLGIFADQQEEVTPATNSNISLRWFLNGKQEDGLFYDMQLDVIVWDGINLTDEPRFNSKSRDNSLSPEWYKLLFSLSNFNYKEYKENTPLTNRSNPLDIIQERFSMDKELPKIKAQRPSPSRIHHQKAGYKFFSKNKKKPTPSKLSISQPSNFAKIGGATEVDLPNPNTLFENKPIETETPTGLTIPKLFERQRSASVNDIILPQSFANKHIITTPKAKKKASKITESSAATKLNFDSKAQKRERKKNKKKQSKEVLASTSPPPSSSSFLPHLKNIFHFKSGDKQLSSKYHPETGEAIVKRISAIVEKGLEHSVALRRSGTLSSTNSVYRRRVATRPISGSTFTFENQVPILLIRCISMIELIGLDTEGLYRLSGSSLTTESLLQLYRTDPHAVKLRPPPSTVISSMDIGGEYTPRRSITANNKRFSWSENSITGSIGSTDAKRNSIGKRSIVSNSSVGTFFHSLYDNDVHVLTGVVKRFLRDGLPPQKESICTFNLYEGFIHAAQIQDWRTRMTTIQDLVHSLPPTHFSTLKYLCEHLHRISQKSDVNKMTSRNLSLIFGPTLLKPHPDLDSTSRCMMEMPHQYIIVEVLIEQCEWVFGAIEFEEADAIDEKDEIQEIQVEKAKEIVLVDESRGVVEGVL